MCVLDVGCVCVCVCVRDLVCVEFMLYICALFKLNLFSVHASLPAKPVRMDERDT